METTCGLGRGLRRHEAQSVAIRMRVPSLFDIGDAWLGCGIRRAGESTWYFVDVRRECAMDYWAKRDITYHAAMAML